MCKTCRRHHPELYTDKPAAKPGKEKKASPRRNRKLLKVTLEVAVAGFESGA